MPGWLSLVGELAPQLGAAAALVVVILVLLRVLTQTRSYYTAEMATCRGELDTCRGRNTELQGLLDAERERRRKAEDRGGPSP